MSQIISCNIPVLILKIVNVDILWICYRDIVYYLENAEMTPELCDDLTNFSFDNIWDVGISELPDPIWYRYYPIHNFSGAILECLKMLVCHHVYPCVFSIFIL